MKGILIFFALFFALVTLLFWAKMRPAPSHTSGWTPYEYSVATIDRV